MRGSGPGTALVCGGGEKLGKPTNSRIAFSGPLSLNLPRSAEIRPTVRERGSDGSARARRSHRGYLGALTQPEDKYLREYAATMRSPCVEGERLHRNQGVLCAECGQAVLHAGRPTGGVRGTPVRGDAALQRSRVASKRGVGAAVFVGSTVGRRESAEGARSVAHTISTSSRRIGLGRDVRIPFDDRRAAGLRDLERAPGGDSSPTGSDTDGDGRRYRASRVMQPQRARMIFPSR
jgi:hypothetical protein